MAKKSINRSTGIAVDAYRKMLHAERKLSVAQRNLEDALRMRNVNMNDYFELTTELDDAYDDGKAIHNVGLSETSPGD